MHHLQVSGVVTTSHAYNIATRGKCFPSALSSKVVTFGDGGPIDGPIDGNGSI